MFQGIHGALTFPHLVEEQEVLGEIDALVQFEFDVADDRGGVQALGEETRQARFRPEVQPVNPTKRLRAEEPAYEPRLAHLPRPVDQQRLASRPLLPFDESLHGKALQHGMVFSIRSSTSESPTREPIVTLLCA